MHKTLLITILAVLVCLCTYQAHASAVIIDKQFQYKKPVIFEYATTSQAIDDKLKNSQLQWQTSADGKLNLGPQKDTTLVKFNLENTSNINQKIFILLENPLIDTSTLYLYKQQQIIKQQTIGHTEKLAHREIKNEAIIFPITLEANQDYTVVLSVNNDGAVKLPISLWSAERLIQLKSKSNLLAGLLLGFLLALVISNLLMFVLTRNTQFILASLFIICLWTIITWLYGFSYRYFNTADTWLQNIDISVLLLSAVFILNPITEKSLGLTNKYTHLFKIQRVILIFSLITILIIPWVNQILGFYLSFIISLLNLSIGLLISIILQIKYQVRAKLVLFYQALLALAVLYSFFVFLGIEINYLNTYAVIISLFSLCSCILSYVLIRQFVANRDEKSQQQHALIAQVKAKDSLLEEKIKIQQEAQEDLESKIQERTFELEITLRELEEKNRELEEKNTHDALTGIRNRLFYDKKLNMEFRRSRREQSHLAIIMLDIDHFKAINDKLGHLAGDDAIKFVANTIKENLNRPSDEACRYGGEEFAVILPNTNLEGAFNVAESIRNAINNSEIQTSAGMIKMTISAGVYSTVSAHDQDPNQLTANADKALYEAKETGRNKVVFYSEENTKK